MFRIFIAHQVWMVLIMVRFFVAILVDAYHGPAPLRPRPRARARAPLLPGALVPPRLQGRRRNFTGVGGEGGVALPALRSSRVWDKGG